MPTYTVKAGDTLSGIGAANGVNYKSITGYRSGNPNLIYPGEVLSWGSPTPAPAAPAPAPAPAAQPVQTAQNSWDTEAQNQYNAVKGFDSTAKNPLDMYNAALEKLGISDARTSVQNLRQMVLNTENLLKNVEGDVSGRTADSLVTENQKRRLVATEQAPLSAALGEQSKALDVSLADYKDIMTEGKAQTDMEYQGQKDRRAAMMDLLRTSIDRADNETKKSQWTQEFNRLLAKDQEETRQWNEKMAFDKADSAANRATSSANARISAGGSGSSSTKASNAEIIADNMQMEAGADGKVSPGTYNKYKNQWVSAGYGSYKDFHDRFWNFANDSHWWDYK